VPALADGWATVAVTFPATVTLSGVGVHSQHSGCANAADGVRIEVQGRAGFSYVGEQELISADQAVRFPSTRAQTWRFSFHAANQKLVTLRGLRFLT